MNTNIALGVQPLRIPDQAEGYQRALTMAALLGQQDLQGLQIGDARRKAEKAARFQRIGQESKGDLKTMRDLLAQSGDMEEMLALDKEISSRRTADFEHTQKQSDYAQKITAGFLSLPPEQQAVAYPQFAATWKSANLPNSDKVPDQFDPSFLPHLQMIAQNGIAPKDMAERADYAATVPQGKQGTMAAHLQPQPVVPQDLAPQDLTSNQFGPYTMPDNAQSVHDVLPSLSRDQELAVANGQVQFGMPNGKPTLGTPGALEEQTQIAQNGSVVADTVGTSAKRTISPDDYRKEAARLRDLGTKVAFDQAKEYIAEADRMDERIWKERDQSKPGNIPAGVTWNVNSKQYEMDGKPISAKEVQDIELKNREAIATKFSIDTRRETKGAEKMGQLDAEHVAESRNSANAARQLTNVLSRMESATAGGTTFSGSFADWTTSFGRLANSIGIPVDSAKIASSEQYQTDVAELVRNKIKALGSGTAISNVDLLFTQKSMPELSKTPDGRLLIFKAMKGDAAIVMDYYKKAREYFDANGSLKNFEYEAPESAIVFTQKKTINGQNYGKMLDGTWVKLGNGK